MQRPDSKYMILPVTFESSRVPQEFPYLFNSHHFAGFPPREPVPDGDAPAPEQREVRNAFILRE